MIQNNQQKIPQKKLHNKVGGLANESRFGAIEREIRKRRVIIAPSINTNQCVKFEQAWNKQSANANVIKITIGNVYCICDREYVEQALATLAQGDEIIKWTAPTLLS